MSVCVDFEYRAVPLFLQTKKIIDENILGKIYLIKLDWLMGSRSDPKRAWNWYSLREKGGGVIGALGTHAFDMLNWFFGESIKVSGKISTSIKERSLSNFTKIKNRNCWLRIWKKNSFRSFKRIRLLNSNYNLSL